MEKELAEQTAFETGGIPTPVGQEHIASTDGIAGAVEGIMDNIEASFTGRSVDGKTKPPRRPE
ncbi:hypothetical protein [Paenibacillus sp.]|uniref:hypothetical protein n=1 Tax=Paenibacillus sp. TaxID=58172 RepID=UPI002D2DB6CC|nr:hypothetical protein [Paenibacillus sp.]HZG55936.1 hypothetical protein [Paenibacillus sp.]